VVPQADLQGLDAAVGIKHETAVFIGIEGKAPGLIDIIGRIFILAELQRRRGKYFPAYAHRQIAPRNIKPVAGL